MTRSISVNEQRLIRYGKESLCVLPRLFRNNSLVLIDVGGSWYAKTRKHLGPTLSIVMVSQALTFYSQRHRKDVSNFDRQFTSEGIELTPTDKLFMMNLDQNEFAGFSFLNPEFVQHV